MLGAAALAVTLAATPGKTAAETRLAEVATRFLVVPPMAAGSKRVTKGDSAFEFPLRWQSAATLSRDLQLSAGKRAIAIRQGQAL
ncbi:hypothetical protein, partial [Sphingomonas sp.]|uniref:hypothetical protein n=1 Tax=Sphingomonas sp. TaxID=28214 RepID=UPI0025F86373